MCWPTLHKCLQPRDLYSSSACPFGKIGRGYTAHVKDVVCIAEIAHIPVCSDATYACLHCPWEVIKYRASCRQTLSSFSIYQYKMWGLSNSLHVQESVARGNVALPHMKAVSGSGPVQVDDSLSSGQLGQIHYVRDSESEYDSDEDPDNDLDI